MTKNKSHTMFHSIITIVSCLAQSFVWSIVGLAFATTGGVILTSKKSPFDMLLGLPMVVIGIGFIVHGFADISMCTFSSKYNKATCFFCSNNSQVNS